MKKSVCIAWIEALRSGNYKQHRGSLVRYDDSGSVTSYCCLGVLCKSADIDVRSDAEAYENYEPFRTWITEAGSQTQILWDMNDAQNRSFPQIADYIEANILPNCTEG